MVSEVNVMEFYRQHRKEIDTLADERSLFVLAFLQHLGPTTARGLALRLGWSLSEVAAICTKLGDADMVQFQRGGFHAPTLCLLPRGSELLRIVLGMSIVAESQLGKAKPQFDEILDFLNQHSEVVKAILEAWTSRLPLIDKIL